MVKIYLLVLILILFTSCAPPPEVQVIQASPIDDGSVDLCENPPDLTAGTCFVIVKNKKHKKQLLVLPSSGCHENN